MFVVPFVSLALGGVSAKILLSGISEMLLPMLSAGFYMVSLIQRSDQIPGGGGRGRRKRLPGAKVNSLGRDWRRS